MYISLYKGIYRLFRHIDASIICNVHVCIQELKDLHEKYVSNSDKKKRKSPKEKIKDAM